MTELAIMECTPTAHSSQGRTRTVSVHLCRTVFCNGASAPQIGEKWKASVACAYVPAPSAATSMLRSVWSKRVDGRYGRAADNCEINPNWQGAMFQSISWPGAG